MVKVRMLLAYGYRNVSYIHVYTIVLFVNNFVTANNLFNQAWWYKSYVLAACCFMYFNIMTYNDNENGIP